MKKLYMIVMLALALALALAVLPAVAETENVEYLDANGETKKADAEVLHDSTYDLDWTTDSTWHVVEDEVTLGHLYVLSGNHHLILCDEATLKLGSINICGNARLTIYAQSTGEKMGKLDADAAKIGNRLAIGVGNGCELIINGGQITATGGLYGAGIWVCDNATLTINDGRITARGSEDAAGIWVLNDATLTINGGVIEATGQGTGAGIGSNATQQACGTVIIHGGYVTAISQKGGGAGIGGCMYPGPSGGYTGSKGGIVTIAGGTVIAKGSGNAPAIGGGSGAADNGSLRFKPQKGKGFVATNLEDLSQVGLFDDSDTDRIEAFTGSKQVNSVKIREYDKAAVDQVDQAIASLPDPGNYTPGDSAVDGKILDAKGALDALKETEREAVTKEHKDKLTELLKKLGIYTLLDGDGQIVIEGTAVPLSFRASGPLDWFAGIELNGKEVNRNDYTTKAGSTIVTLNPGYVATLARGEYTLTIRYNDGGAVKGSFRVVPKTALPQTGDSSRIGLWAVMLMLAGIAMLSLKRKNA